MAQPGARRPPPPVAQQQQFSQQQQQQQQAHNKQQACAAPVGDHDFQSRLNSHSLQNSPTSSAHHHPNYQQQASNSLTSTPYHHHQHQHQLQHQSHSHRTTSSSTTSSQNVGAHSKAADALALAGVKPGASYRGHQRRQSVARLLPDISKLRLLSWLVEASNELINCDIAIMDGVYAKLNRSRESLLFWQQQGQSSQTGASLNLGLGQGQQSKRAPPPRPPPPSVMPVAAAANKAVISNKQRQPVKQQAPILGNRIGSCNSSSKQRQASGRSKAGSSAAAVGGPGSHHSLPLTNYDASSLAALSIRSSKTIPSTSGGHSSAATHSIDAMMRHQNLRHAGAGQPSTTPPAATPKPAARNNRSLPLSLLASGGSDNAQQQQKQQQQNVDSSFLACDTRPVDSDAGEEEEEEEDDDDSSSAASSTTSSGIHETSSSSSSSSAGSDSASSASSSGSSSAGDSSCSFDEPTPPVSVNKNKDTNQTQQQQPPQVSSAEQLSERIRRAVMEHNYLQNLLVNVIRQHDRQRELLERQRRHQMILMRQHGRYEPFGRSLGGGGGGSAANASQGQLLVLPRIDLADIADALDDGCQCSCHSSHGPQLAASSRHHSVCGNSPAPSLLGGGGGGNGQRASTLPTSSSLSLSSTATTATTNQTSGGGRLLVPSRKNRRKKNSEPSREEIIQRLADKLCESCFETHYWLYSCHSSSSSSALATADLTPLQEQQVESTAPGEPGSAKNTPSGTGAGSTGDLKASATREQSFGGTGPGGTAATSKEQLSNLDAATALRNATFIKLVHQQVRSTISNSIELIDLIRKEIKSPESIKQKQLMRCFSASIQLLSSVAGYVVPSQDISTFIQADTGPVVGGSGAVGGGGGGSGSFGSNQRFFDQTRNQQAQQLFNLPPSDFDHLLLQAGLSSPSSHAHYPYDSSSSGPAQLAQRSNYHLAQAPEIPIRRRYNGLLGQRRLSDEANSLPAVSAGQHSTEAFRSLPPNASINGPSSFGAYGASDKRNATTTTTTTNVASSNPNGDESSSGASSNNSSASSSIARNQVSQQQQHPSLIKAHTASAILDGKTSHSLSLEAMANFSHHHQTDDDLAVFGSESGGGGGNRSKFWQSSKFNFIKKLLQVKQQRLLRQQSKDRRIYNNKVANKFRLVMMDLTHFNRSQQLLATENGVNSLLTSMRNVLEFGLYLTVKLY